ncbi:MAG: D-alanyl-D-alanine carboxypeptidase family protein [Coprobacillaceae bacterium]
MKKLLTICLTCMCLLTTIGTVKAEDTIEITAQYALAIDVEQGTTLYEKNADQKMFPASMTKIITVIVALEMIDNLEEQVVITDKDLETIFETNASAAYFGVGETVTYKDLIYGAMLPSGADATRALAFNLCGDLETFVEKMNELVKKLKLENTNFVNTTGIHDENHYTTAHDLAAILKYASDNTDFMEAFSAYHYKSSNGLHDWVNTGMYYADIYDIDISRIVGCKSGYTDEALRCLASVVTVDERQVITIVGHSDKEISGAANIDTNTIAEYCENNYAEVKLHTTGDAIKELPITFGVDDVYKVNYMEDVSAYLPVSYKDTDLTYTYDFKELTAPIDKGQKIGNIKIEYQGKELYTYEFVNDKELKRDTLAYILHQVVSFIFPYGLSIVFIIIYILLYRYQPKRSVKKS